MDRARVGVVADAKTQIRSAENVQSYILHRTTITCQV